LVIEIFSKICRHFPIFVKIRRNNRHFTKRPRYVYLRILGYYHHHQLTITMANLVAKRNTIPMDPVVPFVDTFCLVAEVTNTSAVSIITKYRPNIDQRPVLPICKFIICWSEW
jgi:hypothetical protein